jgi:hypothetical protein
MRLDSYAYNCLSALCSLAAALLLFATIVRSESRVDSNIGRAAYALLVMAFASLCIVFYTHNIFKMTSATEQPDDSKIRFRFQLVLFIFIGGATIMYTSVFAGGYDSTAFRQVAAAAVVSLFPLYRSFVLAIMNDVTPPVALAVPYIRETAVLLNEQPSIHFFAKSTSTHAAHH